MSRPRRPFLGPIKGSFPAACGVCGTPTGDPATACEHIKEPGTPVVLFPGTLDLKGRVANMNVTFELGEVTPKPFPYPKRRPLLEALHGADTDTSKDED